MPRILGGTEGGLRGVGAFLWARYPCRAYIGAYELWMVKHDPLAT